MRNRPRPERSTITESATYTFGLEAGDTIRLAFDDGELTR